MVYFNLNGVLVSTLSLRVLDTCTLILETTCTCTSNPEVILTTSLCNCTLHACPRINRKCENYQKFWLCIVLN